MELSYLGWNAFFEAQFQPFRAKGWFPGRVAADHKHLYHIVFEYGELPAAVSGKFKYHLKERTEYPVVGDWVVIQPINNGSRAIIHAVLTRKTCFVRKTPEDSAQRMIHLKGGHMRVGYLTEAQVVAANVDTLFLMSGLDSNFNLRRIERYLTLVWKSGVRPVIVLNKADLCLQTESCIAAVASIAGDVPIHSISAIENRNIGELTPYLSAGQTVALVGSSGVGKSTLINTLLGTQRLLTGATREFDGKGRHTTTSRELIFLPQGGIMIDTPGMREIRLWADEDDLGETFPDIEDYIAQCRFRNCSHSGEPGCAIQEAVSQGVIDPKRLKNYLRMKSEIASTTIKKK